MNWKTVPLLSGAGPEAGRCPVHIPGPATAPPEDAPPGHHLRELRTSPLALLRRSAEEGAHGLARLDTGPGACLVLNDPTAIEAVLTDRDATFFKPKMDLWKQVLGENVLTSEGADWARSRRRSVRITGARYVRRAARIVAEAADESLRHWTGTDALDIHEEMRTLTLAATLRHLCGTDERFDLHGFGDRLRTVMESIHTLESAPPGSPPDAAVESRFSRAAGELRAAVVDLVARHPGGGDDLIGLLTASPVSGAAEPGGPERAADPLTPEQVCDEVLAHLIAGHESTATSLAWALLLLSRAPDVTRRVRAEIDTTVGNRPPSTADLAEMSLLQAVFLEALRLYPPAWTIMRATGRACELLGVRIPAGAVLLASPYAVQRSGRWFRRPDTFLPDRWLEAGGSGESKYTYFPFGGGRRSCPGRQLAQVTAGVVLTRVLQGFCLEPVGELPEVAVDIILRPSAGTRLRAVPVQPEPTGPSQPESSGHRKESR
ncbi:cytochrome P450 [Streptomyces sp. NPDC088254]|uniref:cytochrome P450 n=1 Tax=Streptomyces sp. NPDC088254 TaxID=3365847 RepID=UPI00382A303E